MKIVQPLACALLLATMTASSAPAMPAGCTEQLHVYFDWNASSLSPIAEQLVGAIASDVERCAPTIVVLTGNIDGSEAKTGANLGAVRAKTVANAIRKLIHAPVVTEDAGFSNPIVPTKAGVREPQNRRVDVDIR